MLTFLVILTRIMLLCYERIQYENRFKQLLENDYFPYILLVSCLLIFYFTNYSVNHDDIAFAGYPSKYSSCLSFIDVRYHTWSSRIIIEAIIYNLIVHPTTWKILNILIMLLLLHSILKITDSLKIYCFNFNFINPNDCFV